MKTATSSYIAIAVITVLAVAAASFAALGSAQAVSSLSCSASPSPVQTGQPVTLSVTGGNGTYTWSGAIVTPGSSAGQGTAIFGSAGTYPVTVTSGTSTATCNVVVADTLTSTSTTSGGTTTGATSPLTCSPASQNVTLGQSATMSASGGNGSFTWSSPDLTINNPTGSGFSANFASVGVKTVTVTSGGATATCSVNVQASTTGGGTTGGGTTPGLPATGGGYGH